MTFIPASSQTAGLDGQNVKKEYQKSLEGLGEQLLPFIWKSFMPLFQHLNVGFLKVSEV